MRLTQIKNAWIHSILDEGLLIDSQKLNSTCLLLTNGWEFYEISMKIVTNLEWK